MVKRGCTKFANWSLEDVPIATGSPFIVIFVAKLILYYNYPHVAMSHSVVYVVQ